MTTTVRVQQSDCAPWHQLIPQLLLLASGPSRSVSSPCWLIRDCSVSATVRGSSAPTSRGKARKTPSLPLKLLSKLAALSTSAPYPHHLQSRPPCESATPRVQEFVLWSCSSRDSWGGSCKAPSCEQRVPLRWHATSPLQHEASLGQGAWEVRYHDVLSSVKFSLQQCKTDVCFQHVSSLRRHVPCQVGI